MARPRPAKILWAVSEVTGIDRHSLIERAKHQWLVEARWLMFWTACRRFGYSQNSIGKFMRRDHTTVMNGLRRVEGRLPEFEPWLAEVEKLLAEPIAEAG